MLRHNAGAVVPLRVRVFASVALIALGLTLRSGPGHDDVELVEASGSKLALTWSDCGSGAAVGKVTDVSPATLVIGAENAIKGTGTLSEDVTGGSFKINVVSGPVKQTYEFDACSPMTLQFPFNLGTVDYAGFECPIAAGEVSKLS